MTATRRSSVAFSMLTPIQHPAPRPPNRTSTSVPLQQAPNLPSPSPVDQSTPQFRSPTLLLHIRHNVPPPRNDRRTAPGPLHPPSHIPFHHHTRAVAVTTIASRRPRVALRSAAWMAVWCQAGREVREGGVGRCDVLGVWWRDGVWDCGICIQAGY